MPLKDNRVAGTLCEVESAIPYAKQQKAFLQLAVCYVRKGICLQVLEGEGKDWINKGMTMLEMLEEDGLLRMAGDEVDRYAVRF